MGLLRIRDLNVQFHDGQFHDGQKGQEAVRHLSFDAAPGEIVGIVGESGSGKSTAMQAVLGLLPDRAEIVCGGCGLGMPTSLRRCREKAGKIMSGRWMLSGEIKSPWCSRILRRA